MTRRRFIRFLTSLLGASTLGTFIYPLFRFLSPIEAKVAIKSLIIARGEIPAGATKDLVIGEIPGIIINRSDKDYIVLSRVCTHLGCLVKYDKERLVLICPCHAGIFDLEGKVVSGPPPKPLEKIVVRVEGDNLVIG